MKREREKTREHVRTLMLTITIELAKREIALDVMQSD
jgi:hypothetical protein